MNDAQIRKIVQEEIRRSNDASRFRVNAIPEHVHNGTDSPKLNADNIIPATSVVGNVEFSQKKTYKINLNSSFTPQRVVVNGIASGTYDGVQVRSTFSGIALLTKTLYLQPSTSTSVVVGNVEYPFNGVPAQNSSSISVFRSSYNFGGGTVANPVFATASEFHICSIGIPNNNIANIQARATITDFSRDFITVDIPYLNSGWTLFINFSIT
jgi:hypothetical protein